MSELQLQKFQDYGLETEPNLLTSLKGQGLDSTDGGSMLDGLIKRSVLCRHDGEFDYYSSGQINDDLPTVILLNAYGVNLEAWEQVVGRLKNRCNILIWETRGLEAVGTYNNEDVFGVEEQAVDILEVMEAESIQVAHIIAWCSGTKPAMVIQSQEPNGILSVTSIAPNLTPFTYSNDSSESNWNSDWDTNVLAAANLLQDAPGAAGFFIDAIRTSIAARLAGETPCQEGRFGLMKMIGNENIHLIQKPFTEVESLINYFKMMKEYLTYNMDSFFENSLCPIHLIITPQDAISNPEQAIKLSSIYPGIEISEVPDGTHFMMLTHGTLIADLAFESIKKYTNNIDSKNND